MKIVTTSWALPDSDTYFAARLTSRGFQIERLDKALSYCGKFRMAVDGGAHIGTWAINMAKCFDRVVAFEPAVDSFECMVRNLADRGIKNVEPVNAALGQRVGLCAVVDHPARIGNTGSRVISNDTGIVPVVTIDGAGYEAVDFIKLDLEGSELLALVGATKTIRKCKPVLMVECREHPESDRTDAIRGFLADLGYKEAGGREDDRVFIPRQ